MDLIKVLIILGCTLYTGKYGTVEPHYFELSVEAKKVKNSGGSKWLIVND